jgi:hypothetical protein
MTARVVGDEKTSHSVAKIVIDFILRLSPNGAH